MIKRSAQALVFLGVTALSLSACGLTAQPEPAAPGTAPASVLDAEAPTSAPLQALSGVKLSDAEARSRVRAAGITVSSSGNCSDRYTSTCTSLEQVNSGTIDGILTLKRASGCAVTITGGTETGHASGTYSHWNGYKLDISKSSCIGNYIQNSFTRISNRGDGAPRYQSAAGNIYADEYWANHWDILYY
ncbi:hypothetical protein DAERI_100132 [Deinococcus aerius]|uniref:Lipoprotein n=1 Tax=Deinococcus aerius TaxID=200253 RepID=A0A2I9CXG2_9DEIO|nr:hypothetical protein [Deinococcus aerius]GBF06769.1 hypothetical protein DAERI_100132 [Deinococcus aerius]